jgi:putative ABC transport system permease protein
VRWTTQVRFVLVMAWRELRASWGRLVFFFLCVAIGVAAIVSLRSVMQHVRVALTREARDLVGADVIVQATQPWTPAQRDDLQQTIGPGGAPTTDVIETQTMAARVVGETITSARLVEIRGIEAGFPFYGRIELADGRPYSHALVAGGGALVQPEVLAQLGANVGDELRLGGRPFRIRGVVTRDRMQRSGFSLGPRVYVDLRDLEATPILGFGSRANYEILLKVDASVIDRVTSMLRRQFRNDLATVRSWRGVQDRLGRNLTLAENYLSLVGFAIVVLGGIGVWSVTRVFVQQKIRSVAILKCLGASSRLVLATYVLQVGWLAAVGSLLGVGLAAIGLASIPSRLLVPLDISFVGVTLSAAVQGVGVGILVSLMFALVPLLEMRRVKPLLLLRADTASTARERNWESLGASAAMAAAVVLVAVWQAGAFRAGVYVSTGLAVVGLALLGMSRLLVRVIRPLTHSGHFALRHAVISLGRPGNQTRVVLMAVGLGCFFVLSMRALQVNLLAEFTGQIGRNAPDLVLIDIQPGQIDGVRAAVAPYVTQAPTTWPMMRARVTGVDGRRVHLPNPDAIRRQSRLTREFGITYREALQDNEHLTAGSFWRGPLAGDRTPDGADTEVSIEENIHDDADVEVGDLMRFDIGGHAMRARVTSIRKVTWDEAQNGGFMFVFRPGPAIERAPHTFVGFLKVPPGAESAGPLQRELVRQFPNVSVIDVRQVLASIREVVDNATLGVTIVGSVTLFGGMLILIGAVAVTKFQRVYEAAIYRTLGAGTRLLVSMTAIEYGLLGLLAGVLGAAGALGLSWAVATHLFEIELRPAPTLLGAGILLTGLVVCVVGVVASADVLMRKPLGTLRNE